MLSYTTTEPYSKSTYSRTYYTFKIDSYATYMYDFKLIVNANDYHKITNAMIDINGNVYDAYSVKLWPETIKYNDDTAIYDIVFWCSDINTPLINILPVNVSCYITIYTSEQVDLLLKYTNCTLYNKLLVDFTHNIQNHIRYDSYSHSEEKIISNIDIKLNQAIDDTYTIYGNGALTIETPSNTTSINCINAYVFKTTPSTITIYTNCQFVLVYKQTNYYIYTDTSLYKRYYTRRIFS